MAYKDPKDKQRYIERFNATHYDRFELKLPKGAAAIIRARAEALGEQSATSYIRHLIEADIGAPLKSDEE